jgi:hypothetical protein
MPAPIRGDGQGSLGPRHHIVAHASASGTRCALLAWSHEDRGEASARGDEPPWPRQEASVRPSRAHGRHPRCVCVQVARVPVRTFAEGDIPATLNLSFSTPEMQLYKNFQAKMVTMKGASGVFGVLPGHVPTIAQLQPGVVTVEYDSDAGTAVRINPPVKYPIPTPLPQGVLSSCLPLEAERSDLGWR